MILPLARWASPLLGDPAPGDAYFLRWFILTMRPQFDPAAASGPPCVYEFRVDDEVIHATVDGGLLDACDGPAPAPDILLTADRETFLGWRTGQLSRQEAIVNGLAINGGAAQLERLERLFPLR